MKKIANIVKAGIAIAFTAIIGVGCNSDRPASNPTDDTSTSEAIVEMNPSAANLNNPRPAPIGDTSVTEEQRNRFGELKPNQDSVARAMNKLDKQKRKQ